MKNPVRLIVCAVLVLLCAAAAGCSSVPETPASESPLPTLSATPSSVSSVSPETTPTPSFYTDPLPPDSEGLAFDEDESGRGLRLTGVGSCTDTTVVVPAVHEGKPVLAVDKYAFKNQKQLLKVILPEGLERIDNYAFSGCTLLTDVLIPESADGIGESIFLDCPALVGNVYDGARYMGNRQNPCKVLVCVTDKNAEEAKIADQTEYIQSMAFSDCANITSVRIPEGVKQVAAKAFYYCKKLDTVYWDAVDAVQSGAFSGCTKFANLYFGENVTNIPSFANCRTLQNVELPQGITQIDNGVFSECSNLVTIDIPQSVRIIGDGAFSGCAKLQNVTIPDYLESVGTGAFSGCSSLRFTEFGNAFYIGSESNPVMILVKVVDDKIRSAVISDEARIICSGAFSNCKNLESIVIPDSVMHLGDETFSRCTSLVSVMVGDGVTEIGYGTFNSCTALKYLMLPSTLRVIGDGAFYGCYSLEGVVLPEGLQYIGNSAFGVCGNVFNELNIPANVRTILPGAFQMSRIGKITVAPGNPVFTVIGDCLVDTESSTAIVASSTAKVPQGITTVGDAAFYGNSNRRLDIPEGVTSIGAGAFSFCSHLAVISLPSTLQYVNDYAFRNTRPYVVVNHTDVRLDYGVFGNVGAYAYAVIGKNGEIDYPYGANEYDLTDDMFFYRRMGDSWALTRYVGEEDSITLPESHRGESYVLNSFVGAYEVTVPASLGTVPGEAFASGFYGRYEEGFAVRVVHIAQGVTRIDDQAFSRSLVERVTIPASVVSIGKAAFSSTSAPLVDISVDAANPVYTTVGGCLIEKETGTIVAGCASAVIPDDGSARRIAFGAFYSCPDLTALYIPASITEIEEGAIGGEYLKSITVAEDSSFFKVQNGCLIGLETGVLYVASDSAVIPDDGSVTRIGAFCFTASSAVAISIPKSVASIGEYAFYACSRLKSIHFGGSADEKTNIKIEPQGNEILNTAEWYYA